MHLTLNILFGMALAASPVGQGIYHAQACADALAVIGGCPAVGGGIDGDRAVLDGELTIGGSPGGSGPGTGEGSPGGGAGGSAPPPLPCEEVFAGLCYNNGRDKPGDGEGAASIPPLTLNDLAAFRPHTPTQTMQPDGWMVVGLPTNFMAHTERHIVTGALLGYPADVRFTPVGYRWRYGDGTAARLTTPGAPWAAQGLGEFDATPTSHVYDTAGRYVIELDVEYTAEYRFAGGSWRALAGVLVRPANDLLVTAGSAVTVLVDRDCASAPRGPGC